MSKAEGTRTIRYETQAAATLRHLLQNDYDDDAIDVFISCLIHLERQGFVLTWKTDVKGE